MSERLGAAVLELRTDDTRFLKGVRGAKGEAERLSRGLAATTTASRLAGKGLDNLGGALLRTVKHFFSLRNIILTVAGGAGLGLVVKRSIDAADAIAKTADSIGVSTDALQEYRFAAGLAGVSTGQLDSGLGFFVKTLGQTRAGTGELTTLLGDANKAFLRQILAARSTEEALDLVFRKLEQTKDASDKAALSAAFFGRTAGVDMVNLVRNGADEIDRMRARARELGLVIDEKLLRKAEAAKDALSILGTEIKTRVTVAVLENADAIRDLAENLTEATINAAKFFGLLERSPLEKVQREIEATTETLVNLRGVTSGPQAGPLRERQAALRAAERALARAESDRQRHPAPRRTAAAAAPEGLSKEEADAIAKNNADALAAAAKVHGVPVVRAQTELARETAREEAAIRLEAEREEIARLRAEANERASAHEAMIARVNAREQAFVEEQAARTDEIVSIWREAGANIGDTLIDALARGRAAFEDLRGVALIALKDIANALLATFSGGSQTSLGGIIGTALGQAIAGAFAGGPTGLTAIGQRGLDLRFAPRQHGGPVVPDMPFLVGERGPELFVPGRAGRIVANDEIGTGGGVTVNLNIAAGVGPAVRAEVMRMMPQIRASVADGVADATLRGGRMRRVMRGR